MGQKVALGIDGGEGGGKGTILDPIYVNFVSFKKGALEQILAGSFLQRALYFDSKRYARAQLPVQRARDCGSPNT